MKYLVVGLGKFGTAVAEALSEGGADVIGVDNDMEHVEACRDKVGVAVQADATDPESLRAVGGAKAEVALVCIGTDFEDAILSVAVLREIGIPRVVARCNSPREARIMKLVGASDVIFIEQELGRRIAKRLLGEGKA